MMVISNIYHPVFAQQQRQEKNCHIDGQCQIRTSPDANWPLPFNGNGM